MTFLRGSVNYVWCTTSVLGKGATGAVFQGVNKHNGEPVAVKTFNQLSHMRPHEVQMREFDVLRKVNHKNIVKLLAIEEEQEGRGKVIVMELCTGGSLFNMLDDPENAYGLVEREFFLVLRHLSDGMKHLRDLNLVHRDLKPGNIMKYMESDGSTVYKLTDFGAARELDDDQQFMSLYGTEEYLHPDMYERAVLRKSAGKTFRATVDLWSIGVTLFHVSTGQLPFRPYGGRKNKETMHVITTKKKPGIISGIQTTEGGDIEWGEHLPATCQLSLGAKKLVTPLLAGLLEVDPQFMWTFDRFFQEVTAMTSRKVVPVFYTNQLAHLKLYLKMDDCYESLQAAVSEQTDIECSQQILLWVDRPLLESVDRQTAVSQYPIIAADQPLVLFDKQNNDVTPRKQPPLPKFPTISQVLSVENDAVLSKMACSVSYEYRRRVCVFSLARLLMDGSVRMLTSVLKTELGRLEQRLSACQQLSAALGHQLSLLSTSHRVTSAMLAAPAAASDAVVEQLTEQLRVLNQLYAAMVSGERELASTNVPELRGRGTGTGDAGPCLLQDWQDRTAHLTRLDKTPARAATHTAKIRDSWQHLLRDRTARNLTYNDEQFHQLEKIKLMETSRLLHRLLDSEVTPTCTSAAELLSDWYKTAQTKYIKTEIALLDLDQLERSVENLSRQINQLQLDYTTCVDKASLPRQQESTTSLPRQQESTASLPRQQESTASLPRQQDSTALLPKQQESTASLPRQQENTIFADTASTTVEQQQSMASVQITMSRLCELEDAMSRVWAELHENGSLTAQLENITAKMLHSSPPVEDVK